MKKIMLSIVLILILSLSLVLIASANSVESKLTENKNDIVKVRVITDEKEINELKLRKSNVIEEQASSIITPAGTSIPTQTWDLRYKGAYKYNTGEFWGSLYTNYKFVPYYDATICFSIDGLTEISGGYRIEMICSDGSTHNIGTYNDVCDIQIGGLSMSKTYYFRITELNNISPYSGYIYGTIS
ncbi:hypothetical protein [Desulfolucanica intricata]|uniref:hypothetical protein n=1 Tax=Desulfolucanica intricata TaxID=1285191 RepID=UPI00082984DF|nr:hypothetical protein [Desulfolucanica intricata]